MGATRAPVKLIIRQTTNGSVLSPGWRAVVATRAPVKSIRQTTNGLALSLDWLRVASLESTSSYRCSDGLWKGRLAFGLDVLHRLCGLLLHRGFQGPLSLSRGFAGSLTS